MEITYEIQMTNYLLYAPATFGAAVEKRMITVQLWPTVRVISTHS